MNFKLQIIIFSVSHIKRSRVGGVRARGGRVLTFWYDSLHACTCPLQERKTDARPAGRGEGLRSVSSPAHTAFNFVVCPCGIYVSVTEHLK